MSAEPSVWVRRNGTLNFGVAYFARDRPSGWAAVGEPFYDRATLDAAVAAARAEERELTKGQIDYPRDVFEALIDGNSPYAFYLFQWVPYQTDAKRWRLKMKHDVRTFDGREAHGIWPNGSHCGPFRDDEVEFIRISRKQWGAEWADPRPPRAAAIRNLKPEGE